jgi:hypothetical protein
MSQGYLSVTEILHRIRSEKARENGQARAVTGVEVDLEVCILKL